MPLQKPDHLIINSPYVEPTRYWERDDSTGLFDLKEGRRPAGYTIADPNAKSMDAPGRFVPIPIPEQTRPRVREWRETGYKGASGTTQALLKHWQANDARRDDRRFFFCQLEAIETLIWLTEAPADKRVGVAIPSDGGPFKRLCAKMATGTGKTTVMAMLIAWQALNKINDPQNAAYSKNILVVAPGLTVLRRLQVLLPSNLNNYYDEFGLVPSSFREKLNQAKIQILNWHKLEWDSAADLAKKRSVDKRGPMSDTAYARSVLTDLGGAQNLIVINDEAHHAWRIPPGSNARSASKQDIEQATVWVGGLDRIHAVRNIQTAYDFSATPFASIGKKGSSETLYDWIVSDFGLNDAIESGLVKTPRVVIRDDAKLTADQKSRFFHIYPQPGVKESLNQKAAPPKTALPQLVTNAYTILGRDWAATASLWQESGMPVPPVMITVANRTETAARIKYAFDRKKVILDDPFNPDFTLQIDSKVLDLAESEDLVPEGVVATTADESETESDETAEPTRKKTKKQAAAELRETVDTVGRVGQPGEQIQNVISVGMLSEGWDAKTVTHIMGLRAFNSQLLCEQVVGRGLRRTSYEINQETGLFEPEYVNIFGVPFTFMPHEDPGGAAPKPPVPRFEVAPDPAKARFEITFPNILRVESTYKPKLTLDLSAVEPLRLNAHETATLAELAPVVDGKPDITKFTAINLNELAERYRTQKIIFETARDLYDQMNSGWIGNKEYLIAQLIRLVEQFITSDKIQIDPPPFNLDELKRRIVITLNMTNVVQHLNDAIRFANTAQLDPVFDLDRPIISTGDMRPWYTSRAWQVPLKSHINRVVYDSNWEASESFELERNPNVAAWVKNDHLGFSLYYTFQGTPHIYIPDFLVRLANGAMLVLEVKGNDSQQSQTKREYLAEWIRAVNAHGGFGKWTSAVSKNPPDLPLLIEQSLAA